MVQRKTQAERREASRRAVLASACRLFGQQGYAATSLEQIAEDCDLTIRPIYHYFKNKKGLFSAVNDIMEQRIVESMAQATDKFARVKKAAGQKADSSRSDYLSKRLLYSWRAYLDLCEDAAFRRIVLIDSPNILGRERWLDSVVTQRASELFGKELLRNEQRNSTRAGFKQRLYTRVVMAAFAEAALVVAEADDFNRARKVSEQLIKELVNDIAL